MTALPATRQEAMDLVRFIERSKGVLALDADTLAAVVVLLKRGAETVGATEVGVRFFDGHATIEGVREADGVRRCLILPENG